MSKQKFFKGDLVHIGNMPNYMRHFDNNCDAIVLYTYAEQYGAHSPRCHHQYGVYLLPDRGECAWYEEDQLTFKSEDRFDLLPANDIHRINWESKKQRSA